MAREAARLYVLGEQRESTPYEQLEGMRCDCQVPWPCVGATHCFGTGVRDDFPDAASAVSYCGDYSGACVNGRLYTSV